MKEVKSIPGELKEYIDMYFNLEIRGHKIICPYFINTTGFLKSPVQAGKGDPKDIEAYANELFSHREFLHDEKEQIRKEMEKEGVGIDCSGLIYQIYNKWLRDIEKKGELKNFLPKQKTLNIRKLISRSIKPESSVSADMFTSEPISKEIELEEIKPGDVIRTRGGKHILFITQVEYENNLPIRLTFLNSTTYYKKNGVRYGYINISNDLKLENSEWDDNDPNEDINYAYKGYRELMNKNGIFRPRFLGDINI